MYIGTIPTPAATESRQEWVATAGQTVFPSTGGTVGYADLFVNGVKMASSDFTFDGADFTLTTGAAAGDVVNAIMRQADNALVALPITDSAGNNVIHEAGGVVTLSDSVVHGPSMIDVYFNNSDIDSLQTLNTTLTRLTDSNSHGSYAPVGTGMTFNSGIFSFPSTGYYKIQGQLYLYNATSGGFPWAGVVTYWNNSGSTDATATGLTGWNQISAIYDSGYTTGGYGCAYFQAYVKVTDISNARIKFVYSSSSTSGRLNGSSTYTGATQFSFIKLKGL